MRNLSVLVIVSDMSRHALQSWCLTSYIHPSNGISALKRRRWAGERTATGDEGAMGGFVIFVEVATQHPIARHIFIDGTIRQAFVKCKEKQKTHSKRSHLLNVNHRPCAMCKSVQENHLAFKLDGKKKFFFSNYFDCTKRLERIIRGVKNLTSSWRLMMYRASFIKADQSKTTTLLSFPSHATHFFRGRVLRVMNENWTVSTAIHLLYHITWNTMEK